MASRQRCCVMFWPWLYFELYSLGALRLGISSYAFLGHFDSRELLYFFFVESNVLCF